MTTVLLLALSQKNLKFPVFVLNLYHLPQPIRWLDNRQYGNNMGTMFVPSRTLCLTLKDANGDICFFMTERDWSWKSCYGNKTKNVILFLLRCTFVVQSLKNTALIFPEIFFIQYFTIFSCKSYDVITDLICIIESKETYGQTRGINSSQKQFTCFYKMFSVSNTFLGLTLWNW